MRTTVHTFLKMTALGTGLLAIQAKALVFVTESQLAANDLVTWGQLGALYATVPTGSVALSTNLLSVTVSTSNATAMERRNQGSGWAGNFASGDHLLWNAHGGGDLVFDFAAAIFGAGTQVQNDFFGPFLGTISAYSAGNSLLGSFAFSGNSTGNADNSAVFAGVYDPTGSITRLVVSVTGTTSFAVNELRLNSSGTAVPDTVTTLPLLGLAGLLVVGLRRKFGRA